MRHFQRLLNEQDYSKVFFLVDSNTHEFCLPLFLAQLNELPDYEILEVESGEESKSAEVLVQLWEAISALGADRHALMVNVGGGMISDLGGFLASTYMRGIPFVNFPTSLLAMVDASVGGKTGVNLGHIKNRVGLFIEPKMVGVVPHFLETLPLRERKSGFAEMLKHGLISDASHWEELIQFDIENLIPDLAMIQKSIAIKNEIVEQDFKEGSIRKNLNFGHTIGHAIETLSMEWDNSLLHGEAVAFGMMGELLVSSKYLGLDERKATHAIEKLKGYYGSFPSNIDKTALIEVIEMDKKNRGSSIRMSLLKSLGYAVPDIEVSKEDILKSINAL